MANSAASAPPASCSATPPPSAPPASSSSPPKPPPPSAPAAETSPRTSPASQLPLSLSVPGAPPPLSTGPSPMTPPPEGPGALDESAARVLLIAAHLAHDSVTRAAAEAREVGEHRAQEAVTARRRSRDALDVAFRAMEAEAEADKLGSSEQTKKQAIPKKSEASRYMVDAFKFNATQQPAAPAFAAAAAAARSMPSSRELGIEEARVATAAAVTRDDDWRSTLFGRLQS
ncbi:hypothetical protein ACP70R_030794 [Stipagrostis hirtigluma subsp. patula]